MRRIINTRGLETVDSCTETNYNTKIASNIRLFFISASKFTCTLFSFAATTAALPMNREIQDMSASVQVKVGQTHCEKKRA